MTVAVVEMRPAPPNEIPVVTATWPRRLNLFYESKLCGIMGKGNYQPVIQAAKAECLGGARIAAQ